MPTLSMSPRATPTTNNTNTNMKNITYSCKVTRRYKTGDQFGRITKGSKIHRDIEIFASDGSEVPYWLYSSLEKVRSAKLVCACLNAGLTIEKANFICFEWAADCGETVEQILARSK